LPLPQDFAALQLDEIEKNIASRRNKIFLLMEEVREGGCRLIWLCGWHVALWLACQPPCLLAAR
jgi:hypothetical protein